MLFIFNGTRSCKFFEFRCRLEIFRLNIGPSMWIRRDHATEPIRHERKKGKKERNELPMACFRRAKKSDSTFCDKSSLVPLLLLLYSCLVSSNRKLYHRRGDTICPSIEKRGSKLARSCNDNENIFRYREGRGTVKSKIA